MSEDVCIWPWTNTIRFFTRLIQWGSACKTSDQIRCYGALLTTTIFEEEFHTCGIPPFCLPLFSDICSRKLVKEGKK